MSFEAQFANTFKTNIVPQEHFIRRKFGLLTSTNESQDICSEHHFDNPNTTIKLYRKYNNLISTRNIYTLTSFMRILEREAVIYLEPIFCTTRETTLILVESDVHDLVEG